MYSLKHERGIAKQILCGATQSGSEYGIELLDATLARFQAAGFGSFPGSFVSVLVEEWAGAFDYLFSQAPLEPRYCKFVANIAISSMRPGIAYCFAECGNFFKEHLRSLKCLRRGWDDPKATMLMRMVDECGVVFDDLSAVDRRLLPHIVESGSFAVNRINLLAIWNSDRVPSIREMKQHYLALYHRIMLNFESFESYCRALRGDEVAVSIDSDPSLLHALTDRVDSKTLLFDASELIRLVYLYLVRRDRKQAAVGSPHEN